MKFSLTVKRLDFSELNVSESGTDTPICLDMFRPETPRNLSKVLCAIDVCVRQTLSKLEFCTKAQFNDIILKSSRITATRMIVKPYRRRNHLRLNFAK